MTDKLTHQLIIYLNRLKRQHLEKLATKLKIRAEKLGEILLFFIINRSYPSLASLIYHRQLLLAYKSTRHFVMSCNPFEITSSQVAD